MILVQMSEHSEIKVHSLDKLSDLRQFMLFNDRKYKN